MFKLRILRSGGYAGISGESNVIKRVLVRGKQKGQEREDVTMVAKVRVME